MSDSQQPASSGQPAVDYLGAGEPASTPRRRRRWPIVAGAAAGVLVVGGVGAWGVASYLDGDGPSPASALPAESLAYLALDLDPGAGQKIEAYQTLKKFPALKDELGLESTDDLRRAIVETLLEDAPCEDLTWSDFEPWLGSRLGVAALAGDEEPVPVVALQVKDRDAAETGLAALEDCAGGSGDDPVGTAYVGDYLVLAETQDQADDAAAAAEDAPLSDDADFQEWVDEVGGAGVVTGYVAAAAVQELLDDALAESGASGSASDASSSSLDLAYDGPSGLVDPDQVQEALEGFEGAAMSLRFDDGALQLEAAAAGLPGSDLELDGDSGIGQLPASTVVAYGMGVGDDFVQQVIDAYSELLGEDVVESAIGELEAQTGLSIPEDVQALLGDGVALAVDESIDFAALSGSSTTGPPALPVGLRISGDPGEIRPAVDDVLRSLGPFVGGQLVVEEGDDAVAVGIDPAYVEELAGAGDLGGSDAFEDALPELDEGAGALFVDFDADGWLDRLLETEESEVRDNVEPLSSLGVSTSLEDGTARVVLRLTTD